MAWPTRLAWTDLETTQLPVGNDYSNVHILEVGLIVTTTDLVPLVGYQEVIKPSPGAIASLRANPEVVQMHSQSGLLAACKKATKSIQEVDEEVATLLSQHMGTGDNMILAGSGVGTFDMAVIREHMPNFASLLAYFVYDVGVFRRMIRMQTGSVQISHVQRSYGEQKVHRAYEDVQAHLEEAQNYQTLLRELTGTA